MVRKIFGILFLIIFFILFYFYFSLYYQNKFEKPIEFEIKKGEYAKIVLKNLKEKKAIPNWQSLYVYLKLKKEDRNIKAGEYLIQPKEKAIDLIDKFIRGKTKEIKITLKEGWTIFDYGKELSEKGICSYGDFLLEVKNVPRWIGARNMEGFLYPDTYFFKKNTGAKEVVLRLYKNFLEKTKNLRLELKNSNLNPLEWVTLGSIVEKEAKFEEEKPKIAGVYLNRLKINMKLEADPTILYAMKLTGIENKILLKKDLGFQSEYNTYLNFGLPPGPICNPSFSSLKAVLYPEKHNFYYFVAKGDGSHYFSENLKEHIKAIQLYR